MIFISSLYVEKHINGPDGDAGEMVEGGLQVVKSTTGHKDKYHGRTYAWWFFTWNNPDHPKDKAMLLKEFGKKDRYILFQYEKGKEGTKHYQGVLYDRKKITCSALSKKMPGCGYLAPVINTDKALSYCGKLESRIDGPWTNGRKPKQGERSDLLECKSIIDNGGGVDELFEQQFTNMVRYGRGLREYIEIKKGPRKRDEKPMVFIYIGDGGMGKTEAVKAEVEEWGGRTYWLTLEGGMHGKVWWGDQYKHYDGEENVVIDEFEMQIRLSDFKRLLDSSPLEVPYKGGYTPFIAKRVWIISNYTIDTWYYKSAPPGPPRNALMRRLQYVEEFWHRTHANLQDYLDSRRFFVQCIKDGSYDIDKAPNKWKP